VENDLGLESQDPRIKIEKILHRYEVEIKGHLQLEANFRLMAKDSENKFLSIQHAYNDLALKYSDVVIKQKEQQKIICRLQNELKSNITKKSIMKSFNNNNINYFDTSPKTSFYKLIKGVPDNKTKKSISMLTYDAHKDLTLKKTSSQIHPDLNINLTTLKENEKG